MENLWQFIPLSKYEKLMEPKSEIARKGVKAIQAWIRRNKPAAHPVNIHAELRSVPQQLLDTVAPPPDWEDKSRALHDVLIPWINAENPEYSAQVIIGAPGSGLRQTLEALSQSHGWDFIDPPTSAEILTGGNDWLARIKERQTAVLVLPELERCYLRHAAGLTLIRNLLDFIWEKRHRYVIGCNSWAWSYLNKVVMLDSQFENPLVLNAFDGLRLEYWFRSIAQVICKHVVVFRQSDNGNIILTAQQADAHQGTESETTRDREPSDFLKIIAARSHGIPLVAWAIWRNCLQISAEESIEDEAQKAAERDTGLTIWVRPWSQTELPAIPSDISQTDVFLLHAALLHGGITEELISLLLSIEHSAVIKSIQKLLRAGLLKEENRLWRVTLSGYPAVHNYLAAEDYLVDIL